jgi:hypothetical protein
MNFSPLSCVPQSPPACEPRKQNYNSGAIFVPGSGGRRTNLPSYTQVLRGWRGLDTNITRLKAAAAAAPPGTVPDSPLATPFAEWVERSHFGPQQERQARLLMHTRWQVRIIPTRPIAAAAVCFLLGCSPCRSVKIEHVQAVPPSAPSPPDPAQCQHK